jgi:hypothetical protein
MGCEDGPTQTFTSAPPDAGAAWNDGDSAGSSDPGQQGFGQQNGGTNKQEICTGAQKATRWAKMVTEPIAPPRKGAGLDLAGDDTWKGLTIEEAEKINCQSANDGDQFGDGTQVNYWGDNGEVWVDYLVSTRKIQFMTFWPGYTGTLDLTSRDGAHHFKIPIQTQLSKDGSPYTIDWNDPTKFDAEVNELYDALTATYAPGLPVDTSCRRTGACVTGNFGDVAYIYWPAVGTGLWVDSKNAPQPTPSIITRIDQYLAKTLPFSLAHTMLKLDAEGPQGFAGLLGKHTDATTESCTLQMGLTYKTFLDLCVKVTNDTTANDTEKNKLLGGLSHSTERFSFDVQGVDLNFTDKTLPATDIIHDQEVPTDDDVSTEFTVDQASLGRIANDRVGNDPTQPKDLHGAGLVYLEYARLVQAALNKTIPPGNQHQLGDPACLAGFGASSGVDPANLQFPAGCTGFEGFVTAAPPTGDAQLDQLAIGVAVAQFLNPDMALGLKPGHPSATFCLDANGDFSSGYNYCSAPQGAQGDLFSTSFARVLQVLGQGKVANLPVEAQDVRFFWRHYVTALVKYMMVAGDKAKENAAGVHAAYVDPDNLFFDSAGAGQFEIGEYVDRRFASATQDPIDLTITADVKNGIFNDYSFSRDIYRGETAIYSAVLEKQTDGIGQEDTGLLTNVFGSPLLKNGWHDSSTGRTAYYCATNLDPQNCDGQYPPLDAHGALELDESGVRPRLARYQGAFGSTAFTLGNTPIKITKTFADIQSAQITMPRWSNPYDPSSSALSDLTILIPWLPKQPGVGFPVALTGTLDKFIETAQLDFSGTTISANVDYDTATDPSTGAPATDGSLAFLAVETTDFLGEVFLCQDPTSGDLLGVRMYTPVATVLDWLAKHPGTYESCGLIIRYSPYGNYADYITSLTNGVRLGITQGGGFGRVVDVTLFVPGQ